MIDKITPRPDSSIEAMLQTDGITDSHAIITGKNTYIAPYVNAEECEYLVIEDHSQTKGHHLNRAVSFSPIERLLTKWRK